ncbi:GNAT family N-acetyltransferase [Ewingella americana]|jgi:N-acetylglutamate synthase-like GNAT family acetyltransferase|uniref:N-acetyltransferase n=1 Tax=Ewingella americana TaxID=41202 RepID=A0A502GTL6_9GAMM|nr:GNAT family N-acetyltransferase [Ewingella americana]TPG65015.1 N-acetyltransferase [Ewingella americana]
MKYQHLDHHKEGFTVTTNPSCFDLHAIHSYLKASSWAPGIDEETVRLSVENSLCFALLEGEKQIGFARLVTDFATFGYLCDVYVLNEYHKTGLGRWLMECCQSHPLMSRLRRIMLVTDSAPWLYEKIGYSPVNRPNFVWQINKPDIYLNR